MTRLPFRGAWLAISWACAFPTIATAQINWTGAATNQWNAGGNWAGGVIPGAADTAVFDGTAAGVIDLSGGPFTVTGLNFTAGNYTLGTAAGQALVATNLTHAAGTNAIAAQFSATVPLVATITGGTFALTNTATAGDANSFAAGSNFTVAAGATLRGSVAGTGTLSPGTNALGDAAIILNGGTLETHGVVVAAGSGLTGEFVNQGGRTGPLLTGAATAGGSGSYDFINDSRGRLRLNTLVMATLGAPNTGQTAARTADNNVTTAIPGFDGGAGAGAVYPGFDYNNANGGNAAPFANEGLTATDNITARFAGKITITNAGDYTFGLNSDDGSMLFLDGQTLINNNLGQGFGGASQPRTGTVNLPAGTYDLNALFFENSVGAGLQVTYRGPDTVANGAATATLVPIPQNVLGAIQGRVAVDNPVSVTATSTLDTRDVLVATYGNLDIAADTALNRTGTGLARFPQTTLNAAAGAASYTFNTSATADVALGRLVNANAGNATTLVKTGPGNLILDNTTAAPTLTGLESIDVQDGRLFLSRTTTISPLTNGAVHVPITLSSASSILQLHAIDGNVTFNNAITVSADATIESNGNSGGNANGTFRLISVSTNPLTIGAGVTVNFDTAPATQLQFNVAIPATTGGLNKIGSGTLALTGGNQYTGPTDIQQGTLQLNGPLAIAEASPITFAAGTTLVLAGATPLSATQQQRLLIGTGGLGTLTVQAANDLNGPINIFGGATLNVNSNAGINEAVNLFPGSVFRLTGNSTAMNGAGAINLSPGVPYRNSTGGNITGAQFSIASIPPGSTLQMEGNSSGLSALQPGTAVEVFGANRNLGAGTTLNGVTVTNGGVARTLNDLAGNALGVGPFGVTVAATNGNLFTISEDIATGNNPLTIGSLSPINNIQNKNGEVRLTNAASNFGTTPVSIVNGSALSAAPTTTGNGGFSNETAGRAMNAAIRDGVLRVSYPTGAADPGNDTARQNLGTVDVAGNAQINVVRFAGTSNRTSTLFLNSLTRSNNGTLRIQTNNNTLGGAASGSELIRFSTAGSPTPRLVVDNLGTPTTINMVAPWIINTSGGTPAGAANFVDYDPAGSTGFTNVAYSNTNDLTGDATTIRNLGAAVTNDNEPRDLAALRTGFAISGTAPLTLHTGGLMIVSGTGRTISKPIVAPAGVELIAVSAGGAIHTLSGQLTGTAGFTKFGGNTLTLSGNNSATLFGDVRINQAALGIGGNNNALGDPANRVIFNGGQLRTTNITLNRDVVIHSKGEFQSDGANSLTTVAGAISGDGRLVKGGVNGLAGTDSWGTVELTNISNTYRGGTVINIGRLRVGDDRVLGDAAGPVTISGASVGSPATNQPGILQASADFASARRFNLYNIGSTRPVIDTQAFTVTLSGPIVGSGGLEKRGDGTLILSHPTGNGYLGSTSVSAGRLLVNNTILTGTGRDPVTVQSGATLGGSGSIGSPLTLNANATLQPGSDGIGTFTVIDQPVTIGGGRFAFQINDPAPVPAADNTGGSTNAAQHDQFAVLGLSRAALSLTDPTVEIFEEPGFVFDVNQPYSWTIARMTTGNTVALNGAVTFVTTNAPQIDGGIVAGGLLSLTVNGNQLNVNYAPVPEPAHVLAVCAAAGLIWRRWRKGDQGA